MEIDILTRALELAAAGIRVMPLKGKIPFVKGWVVQATIDVNKIKGWGRLDGPKYNLGMLLGKNNQTLVCLDIDPRNGGDKWLEANPDILAACAVIEISGKLDGGLHLFFKAPPGFTKSKVIAPGVDYLGDGKQVVMAPSIHPETTFPYMQLKGDIRNLDTVTALPQKVMDLLTALKTADRQKEYLPLDLGAKVMTIKEEALLIDSLTNLKSEKGRHNVIGSWITDAVAAGMPDIRIIELAEGWIREQGREPQPNEVTNWIAYARENLKTGQSYVLTKGINTERITDMFEKKTPENAQSALTNSEENSPPLRSNTSGNLEKTRYNFAVVLESDKKFKGQIAYNELSQQVCKLSPMPWENPSLRYTKSGSQWKDDDTYSLILYISNEHGLEISSSQVHETIVAVSQKYKFHPIKDYLFGLEWDKTPRLDKWLTEVTGCDDNDYTSEVGRILILSMVARIMYPGCKMDTIVILESDKQGVGKSTLCSILATPEFFCETLGEIGTKQTIENTLGHWLVELPEIDRYFNRYKSSEFKAFVSTSADTARLAYGRTAQKIQRQFVMIGTTNKTEYLIDQTGNRRYLPIKCGDEALFALEWLKLNRDQIFAEALARFRTGEKHWPSLNLEKLGAAEQQKRALDDAWMEPIEQYLIEKHDTTITDLCEKLFLLTALGIDNRIRGRVKKCLIALKWKESTNGKRKWTPIRKD